MTPNRTPRQAPGDGLTPVTVRLTPDEKTALEKQATLEQRSLSYYLRAILQDFLQDLHATADAP